MENSICSTCFNLLASDNTENVSENDISEANIYEDLQKSLILSELFEKQEFSTLCRFCKYSIQDHYSKEILNAEIESNFLEESIQEIMGQIAELDSIQVLNIESKISECRKNSEKIDEALQTSEQASKDLEKEIQKLLSSQKKIEYKELTNYESQVEIENRIRVVEAEIQYLSSGSLLTKIFVISSINKIGTINRMRMGRLDYELVPWEEINAAWGFSCFLLFSIFRLKSFQSQKINLYPLGAYSRISLAKDDVDRFELFFSDSNFAKSIQRYNRAQSLFLELLKEFEIFTKETGLPYTITNEKIGNYALVFDPSHKVSWTQALRFLLQDLKYLLDKLSV